MKRVSTILILLHLLVSCATAPPAAPVAPEGEARYLVDPRSGHASLAPAVAKRFETAWRSYASGNLDEARRRFSEMRTKNPELAPIHLALAAIAIRQGDLDEASRQVASARKLTDDYVAADIYEAEIALARNDTRRAHGLYRRVGSRVEVPAVARERAAEIETRLFAELYQAAIGSTDAQAVSLLREALVLNPGASGARLLLARRLLTLKQHEEARRVLDPLLSTSDVDRAEVQELLAEIDTARGRYEEAIARYERLSRRESDPRFKRRLEDIKVLWSAANMPPQFQSALRTEAITRSDFSTLLYWKVASIRFAQNVPAPPIALDIAEVPGRDELIRSIALGIFSIDPVTRRVDPGRPVPAGAFTRLVARVLTVRGASCARQIPSEPNELERAQKIAVACGLTNTLLSMGSDAPVTGGMAASVLEELDRAISR